MKILSELEERLNEPTSRGLAHAVSRAIHEGALRPGTKLPPIRRVATRLALSPTTVSAAWALLARSGAIRTDGRRGTTIADTRTPATARYRQALEHQTPFLLDISTGVPDETLLPSLAAAMHTVTTAGTPSSYLDDPVLSDLQEVLLAEWPYPASELTIVDGAMDALDLVARTVLRLGDRVVVESPCFPPLVDLLEAVGAEIVGVPMEEAGLDLDALGRALTAPATAVFLQPRAHNPTGVSMTHARARAIAKTLRNTDILVVEDDSAGDICTTAPLSLGRWMPEQTVHVRSFSKSHGPDLRLAAMTGPAQVMAAVAGRRQLGQGWSSRLLQRILLSLLADKTAVTEVAVAREEYARRRKALVDALAAREVQVGGTEGINVWVPVHDEAAAIVRLASQGIGVTPGSPFATVAEQPPHIRVTAGLVANGHSELAEQIAMAAHTTGWGPRAR